MAWNEPGGDKKDPWGGGKNDGPPDLDEVVRKLQQKFSSLFGGKGPRSTGDGGGKSNAAGLVLAIGALVLLIFAVMESFYTVEQAERAVVLRFGAHVRTEQPGFNWKFPFVEKYYKVDISTVDTIPHSARMLTKDENIVEIDLAVQYIIVNAEDFLFNNRTPLPTISHATSSAIREIVGKSSMDYVITEGRAEVATNAKKLIQNILDRYQSGISILEVTLQDVKPPEQVKASFDDAIKAREDQQRVISEAEAYTNGKLPVARGQAARVTEEANAYRDSVIARAQGESSRFNKLLVEYQKAPEVTRERLYLETMESIYATSNKILVDVKGGNNLLYLPLDQIIKGKMSTSSEEGSDSMTPLSGSGTNLLPSVSTSTRDPIELRRREVR